MIPFKKLNYDEREINAVAEVMRSGMVGLGDKVFKFEKELSHEVEFIRLNFSGKSNIYSISDFILIKSVNHVELEF